MSTSSHENNNNLKLCGLSGTLGSLMMQSANACNKIGKGNLFEQIVGASFVADNCSPKSKNLITIFQESNISTNNPLKSYNAGLVVNSLPKSYYSTYINIISKPKTQSWHDTFYIKNNFITIESPSEINYLKHFHTTLQAVSNVQRLHKQLDELSSVVGNLTVIEDRILKKLSIVDKVIYEDDIVYTVTDWQRGLVNFKGAGQFLTTIRALKDWREFRDGINGLVENIFSQAKKDRLFSNVGGQDKRLHHRAILDILSDQIPTSYPMSVGTPFLQEQAECIDSGTLDAETVRELLKNALSIVKFVRKGFENTGRHVHVVIRRTLRIDFRTHIRTIIRLLRITTYDGKDDDSSFTTQKISGKNYLSNFLNHNLTCKIINIGYYNGSMSSSQWLKKTA